MIFASALPERSVNGSGKEEATTDSNTRGRKRPLDANKNDNDSDEEDKRVVPPANDIYRLRQQKRVAF